MTFTEIKELHEMGFSADQIMNLSRDQPVQPQEQPEEQPQETVPEQPEEQPQETVPEHPEHNQDILNLQKEIADLKKQIQKQNLKSARVETVNTDLDTQVDQIMSELIRPTIKEEH